jgi:hypothetical protein
MSDKLAEALRDLVNYADGTKATYALSGQVWHEPSAFKNARAVIAAYDAAPPAVSDGPIHFGPGPIYGMGNLVKHHPAASRDPDAEAIHVTTTCNGGAVVSGNRMVPAYDAAPPTVRVKPLEWRAQRHNGWKDGVILSNSPMPGHLIYRDDLGWIWGVRGYDDLDAAKAAAQADYEARILAALAPAASPAPDLSDPNVVHLNMLRGTIAKPTLEQIIHIYGIDALCKALAPQIVQEAEAPPPPSSPPPEAEMTASQFVASLRDDDNVRRFLGGRICCDGQDCGCYGATVGSYLEWIATLLPSAQKGEAT